MFQIFINDEEVICESQFSIEEEFMNPSSVVLYKVYPKSWKGTDKLLTDYYYPQDYSKWKILKDNKLYFVGIVKNSADMELNPFKPHYCSLQILDPSTLLSEGNTLDYVIVDKTVSEAINQVISSISDYGFVAGNIDIPEADDTVIGAYSTLNKTAYDAFSYLSMVSGTRWGTRLIDENTTAIDFFSPEELENQGTIELTKEYCGVNKIENVTYSYSTADYRNKQIITSDETIGNVSQVQTIISDGYNNTYTTEQVIGRVEQISVDGVTKSFVTKNEKEVGVTADFYYEVGKNQFQSDSVYATGSSIQITYVPIVKGREISYNTSEIIRIKNALGRNGTISRFENRNDVISSKELQLVGQSYIKFKGNAEVTLTISSRKDFLKLGGKYYFNAPISDLKGDYLVKAKRTIVFQNDSIFQTRYEYELSNSFDTENELNYFDNQRSKNEGNIEQGEFITRNIDIENQATIIFSNLQVTQIDIDSSNALDSVLNSPLVG